MKKLFTLFVFVLCAFGVEAQQSAVTPVGEIHIFDDAQPVVDTKKPVITFAHAKNMTVTSNKFTIKGTASDENGITTVFLSGDMKNYVEASAFDFEVDLKVGENKFTIKAKDTQNNETIENLTIYYQIERKDYALLFYVSDYGGGTKDLKSTKNDALELAKVLKEDYGFETEVCANFTATEMEEKVKKYAKKQYNNNDQLLIYYSGHGKIDEAFNEGALLCYKNTEFTHDDFIKYADGNKTSSCNHILIVMDACFSGLALDKLDIENTTNYKPTAEEYLNELLSEQVCRKVLTSGEGVSNTGKDEGLSEFTKAFIKSLNQNKGEFHNIISYKEIVEPLEDIYPKLKGGKFNDDDNPKSNFIFIRKE